MSAQGTALAEGYAGLANAQVPVQQTVNEVIESLVQLATSLNQAASQVADVVVGSQPPRETNKIVSPTSLAGRLLAIRETLYSAQENVFRASNGLGAK